MSLQMHNHLVIAHREVYYQNETLLGKGQGYKNNFLPAVNEVCILLECLFTLEDGFSACDTFHWLARSQWLKVLGSNLSKMTLSLLMALKNKWNSFYLDCGERVFFNILKNIKFHKTWNYIVITGRGQPTVATRSIVRKLSEVEWFLYLDLRI